MSNVQSQDGDYLQVGKGALRNDECGMMNAESAQMTILIRVICSDLWLNLLDVSLRLGDNAPWR